MKSRKVVAFVFVALVLAVVLWTAFSARRAYAQSGPVVIPKSYGTLKGTTEARVIFEDSNGTIRFIETGQGLLVQTWVRR